MIIRVLFDNDFVIKTKVCFIDFGIMMCSNLFRIFHMVCSLLLKQRDF